MSKPPLSAADAMLVNAAEAGDNPRVTEALNLGADIHAGNDWALLKAAIKGHDHTVTLLLNRGAYIHAKNGEALWHAAENGHRSTVELLLNRGANVHVANDAALYQAAKNGHTAVVKLLLDRGARIDANDNRALLYAAGYNHEETLELLMDYGANLHAGKERILHWLTARCQKGPTLLALRHGADPHMRDNGGHDSFHLTLLGEWMEEWGRETKQYFSRGKPLREQCFTPSDKGLALDAHVIDACVTGQFTTLIGLPLATSPHCAERQLFQDIWDALPACWQDKHANLYMQFSKEGGVSLTPDRHSGAMERSGLSRNGRGAAL